MARVLIIGGGFSGLASAWALTKFGDHEIQLVEKEDRLGGLISTKDRKEGIQETAANGLLLSPEVESLLSDLNLSALEPRKESRKRYIYRGEPRRWPLSLAESLKLLKAIFLFKFSGSAAPDENQSVEDWVTRLASREVSQYLTEPALMGVYSSTSNELSADWMYQKITGRKRSKGLASFSGGMEELISKLAEYVEKDRGVKIEKSCSEVDRSNFDKVVVATGLKSACKLAEEIDKDIASKMLEHQLLSITSMTVFSSSPTIDGFGCLFPVDQSGVVRGVLQNSKIFDHRTRDAGIYSETWIANGEVSADKIMHERNRLFPNAAPILNHYHVFWSDALPLYSPQWCRLIRDISWIGEDYAFCGNYVNGIGLTQILHQAIKIGKHWGTG